MAEPELREHYGVYKDKYISEHPYVPSDSEAENWLKDKANEYLNYTAMVLDQNQNPPVMVEDKSVNIASSDDLEAHIKNMEESLASLGDDAQLLNSDLQNTMQKQQEFINMLSNISKLLSNTALAVIRKIG